MAELDKNEEQTPAVVPTADDGESRRGAMKRAGLAAAALAVTTFAPSTSAAQAERKAAGPMDEESLEDQIIVRALKDPAYKKRLLADPRKAIAEVSGKEFPADIEIKVVQDTPKSLHLVLPAAEEKRPIPEGDKGDAGSPWWVSRFHCCFHDQTISRKPRPR